MIFMLALSMCVIASAAVALGTRHDNRDRLIREQVGWHTTWLTNLVAHEVWQGVTGPITSLAMKSVTVRDRVGAHFERLGYRVTYNGNQVTIHLGGK